MLRAAWPQRIFNEQSVIQSDGCALPDHVTTGFAHRVDVSDAAQLLSDTKLKAAGIAVVTEGRINDRPCPPPPPRASLTPRDADEQNTEFKQCVDGPCKEALGENINRGGDDGSEDEGADQDIFAVAYQ